MSDFTLWSYNWRKNWVNCTVLTDNNAGLRTILYSRLSHRELLSSFRESHSFLSLPADTTKASSRGTSVSRNSFSRWSSREIYSFSNTATSYVTFCAFFPSFRITLWPMWLANSKRQPCFYPPQWHTHTHTHKNKSRTDKKKNWKTWWGNLCCAKEYSV